MRKIGILIILLICSVFLYSETRMVEISGTISGHCVGKIYIFFEGNFKQRDSISSEIINGAFHFNCNVQTPVLARIHLDANSYIGDFYIDGSSVKLTCTNQMTITNEARDTMNRLLISQVEGSRIEIPKRNFEEKLDSLNNSPVSDSRKADEHYKMLLEFAGKYPRSKVCAYLVSHASDLSFSQLRVLAQMIDPALKDTYEDQNVQKLLLQLDTSKYKEKRVSFHDISLADSN